MMKTKNKVDSANYLVDSHSKQLQYEILYKKFEKAFHDMERFMDKNRKHITSVEGDDILIECIDCWYEEISS